MQTIRSYILTKYFANNARFKHSFLYDLQVMQRLKYTPCRNFENADLT